MLFLLRLHTSSPCFRRLVVTRVVFIGRDYTRFVSCLHKTGSDVEFSILELAQAIINLLDSKSKIVHLPPLQEGDMKRRIPDITKMKDLLQGDLLPVEEGVKKVMDSGILIPAHANA